MHRFLFIVILCFMWIGSGHTVVSRAHAIVPNTAPEPSETPSPKPSRMPRPTPTRPLPKSAHVPILMYHYLSVPPPDADKYRIDLSVTPENFEAQLAYLKNNGYTTISLYDLHAHLSQGTPLPAKPVVLTFDDGYRDAYDNAFPLLKKYGQTATFFIVTDFIHAQNPNYLTWAQVQEMFAAGMSIENHSRTHPDLRNRDNAKLVWEFLGAQESIQAFTSKRPMFFCYPTGKYDANLIRLLRSANIFGALTTEWGKEHALSDAFTWRRVRVSHSTTLTSFASLVE